MAYNDFGYIMHRWFLYGDTVWTISRKVYNALTFIDLSSTNSDARSVDTTTWGSSGLG